MEAVQLTDKLEEECQLFERLVVTAPQGPINFEQMAIEGARRLML